MSKSMIALLLACVSFATVVRAENEELAPETKVYIEFRKAIDAENWEAAESILTDNRGAHPALKDRWEVQNWQAMLQLAKRKADKNPPAPISIAYVKTYNVGDLPLWNEDQADMKVDILFAYLMAKVGEAAWNDNGTMLSPYPPRKSLVINATQEIHDKIGAALKTLRE